MRDTSASMKACSHCHTRKPADRFYRDRRSKDGLCSRCKECSSKIAAAWCKANPDRRKSVHDAWRERNRDHVRRLMAEAYKRNADKIKKRSAEWAKNHPGAVQENRKRWVKINLNRIRQIKNAWKKRNPEYSKQYQAQQRETLSDAAVRRVLLTMFWRAGVYVPARSIPAKLVNAKREQIKLLRLLKEKQK